MKNEVKRSLVISKTRNMSIKNKNMTMDHLLMRMFNFDYAGKCSVFLHKRGNDFELVHQGVHLVDDIFTFSPNYIKRYKFESLYLAILAFNRTVQIITSSMDWYEAGMFGTNRVYDELFIKD